MAETKTRDKDGTVFARVPKQIAKDFKDTAEEHGSTLSADVRRCLELITELRRMEDLADPANFKANVRHFESADELRWHWESCRDDVIRLLGELVPSARARHERGLADFMNEPPRSK